MRFTRLLRGHTLDGGLRLAGGPWYVTGTHKVPGLTYYWQLPVTVEPGETKEVELNESNALVIEGAW